MNLVKNLESLNEPLGKLRIYLRRFKPLEGHYVSFSIPNWGQSYNFQILNVPDICNRPLIEKTFH